MTVPVEVLSAEDVARLLAFPDREDVIGLRDAAVLGALYYAAATAVELASLDLSDLQFRRKWIVLKDEDGTRRRVPLAPELAETLTAYKLVRKLILARNGAAAQDTGALFLANRAQRIRVQDIRQIVGANAKGAGLPGHSNLNTLRLSPARARVVAGGDPAFSRRDESLWPASYLAARRESVMGNEKALPSPRRARRPLAQRRTAARSGDMRSAIRSSSQTSSSK